MPGDPRPIGVFDSGMGGLTVLRALIARLPHEHFVYLGDTARLPYGTKSAETVQAYALQATRLLIDEGVKMLVIACNTASSVALYLLQEAWEGVPVMGVIEPGARAGAAATRNRRIAVIATEGTVKGGAYARAIQRLLSDAVVVQQPCQVFVALAEEGWTDSPVTHAAADRYLAPLFSGASAPDTLVLGCTHFPVLAVSHPQEHRQLGRAGRFSRDHGRGGGVRPRRQGAWQRAGTDRKRALLRHRFARALRPRGRDLPRPPDQSPIGRAGRSACAVG